MKTACNGRRIDRKSVGRMWVMVLIAQIELVAMDRLGKLVRCGFGLTGWIQILLSVFGFKMPF